ncbi:H+-transporting ATPase [Methylacidimicrobium cyclopophantes]|uniref:H+-transporting ATPase n=2 Tax=Methylacidimicrobium cyclopophantes TaxID=1041766 RepID=A0A5E6MFZ6_9BACT|nr:H+-transporting ATPase [Methylacidimicrobium cyclopophantes]
MTCSNCARHVQTALCAVPKVTSARVDLEKGRATVEVGEGGPTSTMLVEAVQKAGYEAAPAEDDEDSSGPWQRGLLVGVVLTPLLFLLPWLVRAPPHSHWLGWLEFALALPVQLVTGRPFYQGAYRQLLHGRLDMDVLVSLGSSAAFLLSVYGLLRPGSLEHGYFDEAAAILTLVSVGHWLEARVSLRASRTLRTLLALAPPKARRRLPDGREEEVPVEELQKGDLVVLAPGDRVPVDGVLAEGKGILDESMLTGESQPVEKSPGEPLYAGTINMSRQILMRDSAAGSETVLAHIAATVERAQQSRAAIQRLVDRVSNVFVLTVLVLAAATVFGWGWAGLGWEAALLRAASVLVVACPCAMGLATPAAILVAANVAAQRGVLLRDAQALEKCGRIRKIVFDKTGTLTEPTVGKPVYYGDAAEAERLARSLAGPSRHPLSQAVARYFAQAQPVELENWEEERGLGVRARYQDKIVRLGSLRWLEELGIALPEETAAGANGTLGLAMGKQLLATFPIVARPKPSAAGVLRGLQEQGYTVYLLSGDRAEAAFAFSREVGIPAERTFAEVRPEGKAELVQKLQSQGGGVAFVGDGINDAPALAQADLGIAVLQATDIARESADVILLRKDIEAIPEILSLSAKTLRTIRENLFWAFFYNAAAIPLAIFGVLAPAVCAAAMGMSDLFVVGNALRLYRR